MKRRLVKVGPRADRDIRRIGANIAHFGAPVDAERLVERLYDFVWRLDLASQRGLDRSDIRAGLRIIAFEKTATLAVLISDDAATLVRAFYRGQDWEDPLRRMFARKR